MKKLKFCELNATEDGCFEIDWLIDLVALKKERPLVFMALVAAFRMQALMLEEGHTQGNARFNTPV